MEQLSISQVHQNLRTLKEIERVLEARACTQSYEYFIMKAWPIIEPGVPYYHGWHISAICKHLEAVAEFKITKLIVNIPPRHMKSILCAVTFTPWVWIKNPSRKFIYASYAENLAVRDSIKARMLIESDWYQNLFRPKWKLSDDQNQKMMFKNTENGERHALGVGSGVTGKGGDHLFIDDPMNATEGNSSVVREAANTWHDIAFSSRYNDPKRHTKVIIMQRLHENDLTGHVLSSGQGYEHLVLPAEFNPDSLVTSKTSLNFKDPRTEKGQLLWPERFDKKAIEDLQKSMDATGQAASEAQLQQDPKPKKGGLFPREMWQEFETWPDRILEIVQFIDSAQKPGLSNDYSVIATWARTENGFFILDVWREKVAMPYLEEIVKLKAETFKPNAIVIEDKSGGSSLIQYLVQKTTLPVLPYDPGQKDKEIRATAASPTVHAKKVHLPKGAKWKQDFISEHETFPRAKNDDTVDTTSMAVSYFNKRIVSISGPRARSL